MFHFLGSSVRAVPPRFVLNTAVSFSSLTPLRLRKDNSLNESTRRRDRPVVCASLRHLISQSQRLCIFRAYSKTGSPRFLTTRTSRSFSSEAFDYANEKFAIARTLCVCGGNSKPDTFAVRQVLYAAGIHVADREIEKYLETSGEEMETGRGRKRRASQHSFWVRLATNLCIEGGEMVPSAAAVQRVLESAGIDLEKETIASLMTEMTEESAQNFSREDQNTGPGNPGAREQEEGNTGSGSSANPSSDPNAQSQPKNRRALISVLATGAIVLFGKTKYILVALKLTKFSSLLSMVLTSFAYSFIFGWPYAIGMVGLLLAHESGHALVMRHYGVPFSPMVFVPFVGAWVQMNASPRSAYEEAIIALGGPYLGSAAAVAVAVYGGVTGSQLLVALADFGLIVNLFNLLPVGTLDGGRVGNALWRWFNVAGLAIGTFLITSGTISNPIFYLIMITGAWSTYQGFKNPPHPTYAFMSPVQRTLVAVGYFGLIGALLFAMRENNKNRQSPKQLRLQQQDSTPIPHVPEDFYDDSQEVFWDNAEQPRDA